MLAAILPASPLLAQSVDIEKSLYLDRVRHPPLLKIRPWKFTRAKIYDATEILKRVTGLQVGISYTTIYQSAPEAPTPHYTWVSSLDLYQTWNLTNSSMFGEGTLGGLFRYRTNFGPVTGNELSQSVGLPWSINNSGSDGYARFNQLWWQQSLLDNKLVIQLGKIDPTTHFDQNRVASSDARDFMMQSLVNSQTIAFPSPGMGFNIHYAPSSRLYLDFGLSDANGDPQRSPHDSLDSFLKGQYFQALEVGYSVPRSALSPALGEGNYRLMFWNAAQTESHPYGHGIAFSIDQEIVWSLVPFTRIGYCPQGVYRTSTEVDWGVMWVAPFGRPADRMGLGATWAKPTATPSRDQFAMELLYRVEFVEGIQLSPDVQFIFDPALNPSSSFQTVFGLRIRAYI